MEHQAKAANFLANEDRAQWHDQAVWHVRAKRDDASKQIDEWESLRTLASTIKEHTLSKLDDYLESFEKAALNNGVHVHWAVDAESHNQIVHGIIAKHKAKKIIKSKSMLTEECHLNQYLEARGVEVVDSDLGERIIQLKDEAPSHIVMPAVHLKKEEISDLFHDKLGTEKNNADPQYLTEAARQHLRQKFLGAEVGITGVNFGVAETGGVVVCTNEGNADLGVHIPPVQIHCMGIEKLIPRAEHLGVFTRLLARSGTGQPITIYTSHFHRPKPNGEMHIVIVDNGRSTHLAKPDFRNGLKCIRCGACLNTCPIYRRSGGHSYRATIPGPIGSILNPRTDLKAYSDLPYASSLCGSCSDVCPVKIDIHEQLYKWRQVIEKEYPTKAPGKWVTQQMVKTLADPKAYDFRTFWLRKSMRFLPSFFFEHRWNPWTKGRKMPTAPRKSFKEWYQKERMQ